MPGSERIGLGISEERLVDYDRLEVPKTSGRIRIRVRTQKAALIAAELSSRIGR